MNPGDLSRMAVFDGSSLSAGARLVLLSLAAASGPDNVAHVPPAVWRPAAGSLKGTFGGCCGRSWRPRW